MSFTCKGHDTLSVTVDRDMSCIELVDRRGDVAEAFQLRGQPEAEALLAKLKVEFAKCSRERSTTPRAGLPAEFVTFDGATCEQLCEALDHFWICGGGWLSARDHHAALRSGADPYRSRTYGPTDPRRCLCVAGQMRSLARRGYF